MTPRQQECLVYIRDYIAQREFSPSFDEIRNRLGLASKSGVHRLVAGLVVAGKIRTRPFSRRSIELVDSLRPTDFIEPLVKALMERHLAMDADEDSPAVMAAEEGELRQTITNVLARVRA